jgi:hypothetical protein
MFLLFLKLLLLFCIIPEDIPFPQGRISSKQSRKIVN